MGFEVALTPTISPDSTFAELASPGQTAEIVRRIGAHLDPPTDDRPFFFKMDSELLNGLLTFVTALSLAFITNFTPDMQLYSELQFDNVSEKFALSMRYRWEYEPGQEIFASIGQSALIPGQEFAPRSTQAVIRLGHTFRY